MPCKIDVNRESIFIYSHFIYIYICVCVCVCIFISIRICVCESRSINVTLWKSKVKSYNARTVIKSYSIEKRLKNVRSKLRTREWGKKVYKNNFSIDCNKINYILQRHDWSLSLFYPTGIKIEAYSYVFFLNTNQF